MALHSVMYVCRCIVRCVKPPPPHVNYTSDVRVYLCYTRVIESIVKSVEKATPASSSRRSRETPAGGRQVSHQHIHSHVNHN